MTGASRIVVDPFFLKGGAGNVFCAFVHAADGAAPRSGALFVPPFGEEMNKSRRQVMLGARAIAAAGRCVLVVDLFGTGDSDGDLAGARWDIWLEDLRAARRWLAERGIDLGVVWALRTGALLAADLVRLDAIPARILLWQPVTHGQRFMEQFLRLRVAVAMVSGGASIGVKDLRQELERGSTLEVAGYELTPDLVREIDSKDLSRLPPPAGSQATWIEVAGDAEAGLAVPSQRAIAVWQAAGVSVETATVPGVQFWSTVEIAVVPELNERSVRLLGPV